MYGHRLPPAAVRPPCPVLGDCGGVERAARSRGWAEATFWAPTVGKNNLFVAEREYPDLATFQRETEEFYFSY